VTLRLVVVWQPLQGGCWHDWAAPQQSVAAVVVAAVRAHRRPKRNRACHQHLPHAVVQTPAVVPVVSQLWWRH
jgi:hypothetical protein